MRNAIICVSMHHGNTRRIAEAMAEQLDAQVLSVDDAADLRADGMDLLGLGSGIYFGRHHRTLLRLVDTIPTLPLLCFIFSTAGIASLSSLWHRSLARRIERRQSKLVGQFCCPGWDTVGPLWLFGGLNRRRPDSSDFKAAATFAQSLLAGQTAGRVAPSQSLERSK